MSTDPRVLVPEEDEQEVIVKAAFGGSGKAYHTAECVNVRRMRQTNMVKISVAEWKGYHECERCQHINKNESDCERKEADKDE